MTIHEHPSTTGLTPATFDQWMAALESGDYPKTTGCLKDSTGFCCLGVLADIEGAPWAEGRDVPFITSTGSSTDWDGADGGELRPFLLSRCAELDEDGDRVSVMTSLIVLNDSSTTFAPVIAKARELYAQWKAAQR